MAVEFSDVHRLSTEEFHQMVESGALEEVRVEFINGLLVDMSPPSPEHDGPIEFLNTLLARALDPTRYRLRPQMALSIADSAPQPDIAVVAVETSQPYYPATAELVIEVSRASLRRDLIVKPPIYASAGVAEYWGIDVDHARVLVHRNPADQSYRSIQVIGQDGILDGTIVGLDPIPVAEILAPAQPPQ